MNYMTSAKTLYKAAQFGIITLAVMAMCVPSTVVMARGKLVYNGHTSSTTTDPSGSGSTGSNGTNNPVIVPDSEITVSTEPAINIKTTSALIQGGAHVDSGTAAVWFEWGTRIDKLENTTRKVYVDRMSTGSSEMLTNLAPGTKYYFRIVAHNATGTCYGTIKSFVTAGTAKATTTKKSTRTTIVRTASASESESNSVTTSRSSDSIKGSLSAAAANANSSSGVLPNSILGWVIVIVLVFVIAVVVRAIQREGDIRKKREEEAKKAKAV
jgi:hypothetical protein